MNGVVIKQAEVWRKRGNNWRKEGKRLKVGEDVTGKVSGDYWYFDDDHRTKRIWIKVVETPEPKDPPVVPPAQSQTWYFVKWQWLRADAAEYHQRTELPMVFRMGDYDNPNNTHFVTLTKAWQFFWFDLCSIVVFGKYHDALNKEDYRWLANRLTVIAGDGTAFNNGHGMSKYRNYLTGENMDTKEDPALCTIITSGASLQGVEVGQMLKVAHFDGNQPPPDVRTIDPYKDPRVFFAVTGGDYHANPFPQFGGKDVPIPIIAYRDIYFPLRDVEKYESPTKRRPYYP